MRIETKHMANDFKRFGLWNLIMEFGGLVKHQWTSWWQHSSLALLRCFSFLLLLRTEGCPQHIWLLWGSTDSCCCEQTAPYAVTITDAMSHTRGLSHRHQRDVLNEHILLKIVEAASTNTVNMFVSAGVSVVFVGPSCRPSFWWC